MLRKLGGFHYNVKSKLNKYKLINIQINQYTNFLNFSDSLSYVSARVQNNDFVDQKFSMAMDIK